MSPHAVAAARAAISSPPIHVSPAPLTYGMADAEAVSGLSRGTLYRLAAAGRLRLVKVGSRTLVDAASLRALLLEDAA